MRLVAALLLAAALAAAGDDLSGEIRSGKPRKLVDEALPLLEEGDAIYREWILEQIGEDVLLDRLERAIACYDEASAKLQAALDIEYDPGVNHRLRVSNRRLQKMRFRVHFQPPEPSPGPKPAPPEPTPEPPEPKPEPPVDVLEREEEQAPRPAVTFDPGEPPARPVDADLPAAPGEEAERKRDERAIRELLKDYYQSRKPASLLFRCRLCRGQGALRDGSSCKECAGAGKRINLYHFRKAYWGVFSPALRDAPGALEALRVFHERAQQHPEVLAPLVKSYRLTQVEHKGYWARVQVEENTDEGKRERSIALVGTGRSWYFYHPATDAELVPEGGG